MTTTKLGIEEWIEFMKKYFLTIGDIQNLKEGEIIDLLCLDRNWAELASTSKELMHPEIFFKNNYKIRYKHTKNLQGECLRDEEIDEKSNYQPFEFDIEFKKGYWYPLKNGKLPQEDPQGLFNFDDVTKDYKEYDADTCIGWRGPMINWEKLRASPSVCN